MLDLQAKAPRSRAQPPVHRPHLALAGTLGNALQPWPELDEDQLQSLHLQALREGRTRLVVNLGDAEGLLWEAPRERVRQQCYPAGSEVRALLDGNGRPLAWWQRYVTASVRDKAYRLPYDIPNVSVHAVEGQPARSRGSARLQNGFFAECFIDELACAAGQDGYGYRRALLGADSRHLRALDAAARHAGWGAGRTQGLALVETDGVVVAEVIEVSADASGHVQLHRVVAVVDCGGGHHHPPSASLQAEVAILMGLDAALAAPVAPARRPHVEVHFLPGDGAMADQPEAAMAPVAPALANAVFAATGRRLRALPFDCHPTAVSGARTAAAVSTA